MVEIPTWVFVVAIVLMAFFICAGLYNAFKYDEYKAKYEKAEAEIKQRREHYDEDVSELRKVLSNLARILPAQHKILGDDYAWKFGGWYGDIVNSLAESLDNEQERKAGKSILKALAALSK